MENIEAYEITEVKVCKIDFKASFFEGFDQYKV